MKEVFTVCITSGEYEDCHTSDIAAFSNKKSADLFCRTLNARLKELGVHRSSERSYNWVPSKEVLEFQKQYTFSIESNGAHAWVSHPVPSDWLGGISAWGVAIHFSDK